MVCNYSFCINFKAENMVQTGNSCLGGFSERQNVCFFG